MAKEKLKLTQTVTLSSAQRGAIHAELVGAAAGFNQDSTRVLLERVSTELADLERLTGLKLLLAVASDSA